jgi:hypothetical protein
MLDPDPDPYQMDTDPKPCLYSSEKYRGYRSFQIIKKDVPNIQSLAPARKKIPHDDE